jgi:tripartite-type tricarboxylate transporter receptor subunit TctC
MNCPIRRRGLLAAAAAAPWLPARSQARFPERSVRIVVPYGAGVGPDVVARSVAEVLSRQWRQPVLIENKPGASGIVAFTDVRRTPPDGYTLFVADTATMCVNPLIHDTLPYDPARDLVPLTLLFRATFVIVVGGDSRFTSVTQLLDAARRKAESVTYASATATPAMWRSRAWRVPPARACCTCRSRISAPCSPRWPPATSTSRRSA